MVQREGTDVAIRRGAAGLDEMAARRRIGRKRARAGLPPATDNEFYEAWDLEISEQKEKARRRWTKVPVVAGLLLCVALVASSIQSGGARRASEVETAHSRSPFEPRPAPAGSVAAAAAPAVAA